MTLLVDGSQTVSAYSTIGQHRLVYARSLASFVPSSSKCFIPPSSFLDLEHFFLMIWWSIFRSAWMVTPTKIFCGGGSGERYVSKFVRLLWEFVAEIYGLAFVCN